MIKRIVLLVLCLRLLCGGSMKVFADEVIREEILENKLVIRPYMDYIARASCFLYIDSDLGCHDIWDD